jgi:hypothetical protein
MNCCTRKVQIYIELSCCNAHTGVGWSQDEENYLYIYLAKLPWTVIHCNHGTKLQLEIKFFLEIGWVWLKYFRNLCATYLYLLGALIFYVHHLGFVRVDPESQTPCRLIQIRLLLDVSLSVCARRAMSSAKSQSSRRSVSLQTSPLVRFAVILSSPNLVNDDKERVGEITQPCLTPVLKWNHSLSSPLCVHSILFFVYLSLRVLITCNVNP